MKTTHDILREFIVKACDVEKELKTNALVNQPRHMDQLYEVYLMLFPERYDRNRFGRWYCYSTYERDILHELCIDNDAIPVSGQDYKKVAKLYDAHLEDIKNFYVENYSSKAYEDDDSIQKDLDKICSESQDEYEKRNKIGLYLNEQVNKRFYAWLHDNSESFWCCIMLLLVFGIASCLFIFHDNDNDEKMSQHQDEIRYAFYNEVKDDRDFSEFNFKFKEHQRKLCDLVENGIVKMFLNKNAGSANIAVYFEFIDKKYVFTEMNGNMFSQYHKNILWVSPSRTGFTSRNGTHIPVTMEELLKFMYHHLDKQVKKDFMEFINGTVVKYKIDF